MSLAKKILSKAKYYVNYFLANTIYKKRIDSENNCFNIMPDEKLVDKILDGYSFSRLGDGELSLIYNKDFNISFQKNDKLLTERLKEVLNSNLDNLIIGINTGSNNPSIYNKKVQKYYRAFNYIYRDKYKAIISIDREYGNASITRFYIDYDTRNKKATRKRIDNIKRIWDNRNLLIVEGEKTRLGVGNDLFANAKQIRRIIVPSTNAFDKYEKIFHSTIKNARKGELILLSIGPTATVLAYDLAKNKLQAIDVGHIDLEYEWMRMGAKNRVPIQGKYTNEVSGNKFTEFSFTDNAYKNSIIETI